MFGFRCRGSCRDGATLFTRSTLSFSPEHLSFSHDQPDKTIEEAAECLSHFSHQLLCGDIRLLHRLFVQIGRILKINGLSVITDDVVEAARSTLVIGAT
jgi:hypothetical protein